MPILVVSIAPEEQASPYGRLQGHISKFLRATPVQGLRHRGAFTLVEMLVAIAIGGALVAMLLGAVQRTREASNRLACANNLRQIGLAMHLHHDTYHCFPSNGGWDGEETIQATDGSQTTVWVNEFEAGLTFTWGVGKPGLLPTNQTGSWAYAILPFLEQQTTYEHRAWTDPVRLYFCPSRRSPVARPAKNDQYGRYQGGGWQWAPTDYAANALLVPNRPVCMRMEQILDGTSNTILVGEKSVNPLNYHTGTWYWDEPFFTGGSGGTQRGFGFTSDDGLAVLRDDPKMGFAFRYNWGSAHGAGVQFLFADGSIHLVPFGIPSDLLRPLLTPASGDIVSNDF